MVARVARGSVDDLQDWALNSDLAEILTTLISPLGRCMRVLFLGVARASSVVLAAVLVATGVSWAVHCLPPARSAVPVADSPHLSCATSPELADGSVVAPSSPAEGLDDDGQYVALAAPAESGIDVRPAARPMVTRTGRPTFFSSHRFLI